MGLPSYRESVGKCSDARKNTRCLRHLLAGNPEEWCVLICALQWRRMSATWQMSVFRQTPHLIFATWTIRWTGRCITSLISPTAGLSLRSWIVGCNRCSRGNFMQRSAAAVVALQRIILSANPYYYFRFFSALAALILINWHNHLPLSAVFTYYVTV